MSNPSKSQGSHIPELKLVCPAWQWNAAVNLFPAYSANIKSWIGKQMVFHLQHQNAQNIIKNETPGRWSEPVKKKRVCTGFLRVLYGLCTGWENPRFGYKPDVSSTNVWVCTGYLRVMYGLCTGCFQTRFFPNINTKKTHFVDFDVQKMNVISIAVWWFWQVFSIYVDKIQKGIFKKHSDRPRHLTQAYQALSASTPQGFSISWIF